MHDSSGTDNRLDFLLGSGEMGTRIRAHDWTATPLGHPESWSQALKVLVGVMLGSAQPMFLVWGPERILLYNDACAEILARKHPAALGRDFLEVWHEIRGDLLPIIEQVYAGEPISMDGITMIMERRGYPEETHFSFSYTPVRGEKGAVAGFFCVCTEITRQVMAERQLASGTEPQRRLFEQAPGFIAILKEPGHVFEFVNQAYRNLIGNRDCIGRGAREVFPEFTGQGLFDHLDRVYATGERFVAHDVPVRLQRVPGAVPEERFLSFIYEPMLDAAGRVTGIFCEGHDVTETHLAQTALAASEERFRAFVTASSDVVYRMSPDWGEMRQLDGRGFLSDTAEPTEGWLEHYIHPDDQPVVWAAIAEAIRTRSLFELEHRVRRADGTFGWTFSRAVPILDENGEITEWLGAARDVTARREAEAALRASEERLRRVMETEAVGVLFFSREGMLIGANDVFLRMTGWSREEVESGSLNWRRMTPPEWVAASEAEMDTLRQTGRLGPYEKEYLRKDGSRSWMLFAGRELGDGTIVEFAVDISARKQAETALRESEAQFRSMADSLPQLAWMADENGWIYWYNRRWYEYTGTTPEEVEGWGWRKVHHPDHVDRVVANIQRSWDTGEHWEDTFPLRGADRQYRWFLSRAVPIRDSEGRVTRWFGTNTDITERHKREELQKLLIHEISHRVKNSLSVVSALLQLQARTLEAAPRHALEDASSRVGAVATVHDQLWRQADAREVDLASFLSNLGAAIATAAPRHATVIEVEPAVVSADLAVPLGLLVNELLTNSYKYAYPEGEEGEVRVAGKHATEGRYRLEVSDLGRGLPSDFDLGRSRTSLGMRVVTSMAAQLNGRLIVGSAEPGTRFTLEFPLKEAF